jgi:hypothetical protein
MAAGSRILSALLTFHAGSRQENVLLARVFYLHIPYKHLFIRDIKVDLRKRTLLDSVLLLWNLNSY